MHVFSSISSTYSEKTFASSNISQNSLPILMKWGVECSPSHHILFTSYPVTVRPGWIISDISVGSLNLVLFSSDLWRPVAATRVSHSRSPLRTGDPGPDFWPQPLWTPGSWDWAWSRPAGAPCSRSPQWTQPAPRASCQPSSSQPASLSCSWQWSSPWPEGPWYTLLFSLSKDREASPLFYLLHFTAPGSQSQ